MSLNDALKQSHHPRCCSNCGCTGRKSCPGGCCWTAKNLCCKCDLFRAAAHHHPNPRPLQAQRATYQITIEQ